MELRPYLDELRKLGLLKYVNNEVSLDYEIPAVLHKLEHGPTLLFKRVKDHPDINVVGNLLNTREKVRLALNVNNDEGIYMKLLRAQESAVKPKEALDSPHDPVPVDLASLPIPRYFEFEPGPCITSAVVIGLDLKEDFTNMSIHRLTPIGKDKFVIRIVPRHLYRIYQRNKELGKDTPVAIAWGLHPSVLIAAASSPPLGVSELNVANALLNNELKVRILDNGVPAPASAEILMEGYISASEEAREGPCMDILGTYDHVRMQPVVRITRIYVRRESPLIIHALVAGDSEHRILMGLEREAKIWQFVRNVVPEVKAVRLTPGGCGWLHAVISVRKQSDGDPKNVIMAAFAAHPSLKYVVVVDDDVDVDNPTEVEWAIATRFRADEDLVIIKYARGSTLDPVAIDPTQGITTKMGIDATIPINADKAKFRRGRIPLEVTDNLDIS